MICVVDLCEVWAYLSTCEVMWNYVFFLRMVGDHVDYDYMLICVVLESMHDYSYLTIRVYDGYIDDVIVMYRMT